MDLENSKKYTHLLSPMYVGKAQVEYKNRVFVAPCAHLLGCDANGILNFANIDLFEGFAKGGFASVCLNYEIPRNGGHPRSLYIGEENIAFADMHILQRIVHAYRTRTSIEIYHAGCCMTPGEGRELISASDMLYNGQQVRAMNEDDMEKIAQMYVDAAVQAKRAGFDAITLHYGHGWLMNNFLSPLSNHRNDEYGGVLENRCRFPLMVLKRIRQEVGDELLIEIRLNGSDKTEGGITPEDSAEQVMLFQDYADMIHMTCGTRLDATSRPKMHPTHFIKPAHNADASELAKKKGAKIPIGVVGAIHTADLAEQLLAEEKADYILMARQAFVDPQWVNKVKENRTEDIRPCLRCDYCLDGGRRGSLTKEVNLKADATFNSECSVNPLMAQGYMKKFITGSGKKKKLLVIGGGIAGMQAALTAHERGHEVILCEKTDKLGGQALLSDGMWFKKEMKALHEYFAVQIAKSGIQLLMNTAVTPEIVEQFAPDAVFVAIGAEQVVPKIKGIEQKHVLMSWDVFGKEEQLQKNLVIIGGGLVGCELAIHLAGMGKNITLVEMGHYMAPTAEISERMSLLEQLDANKIACITDACCKEITNQGVIAEVEGRPQLLEAEQVIISVGTKALSAERDAFQGCAFEVVNIGDCLKASTIRNAVTTAYDAAITL